MPTVVDIDSVSDVGVLFSVSSMTAGRREEILDGEFPIGLCHLHLSTVVDFLLEPWVHS